MEQTNMADAGVQSNIDMLRMYKGMPVQFSVSYEEHNCRGNVDDSEYNNDMPKVLKVFNYPLLNLFMTGDNKSNPGKYQFILSTFEGKEVLIPFRYKATPYLSLRRSCQSVVNSISDIIIKDGQKIAPDPSSISAFDDGILNVIANDEYTREDAASMQDGPALSMHGCMYDRDNHIIMGNIGSLISRLTMAWK